MSKIRYILRLIEQGRSKIQIYTHGGISKKTLDKYLRIFEHSSLTFEQLERLTDKDLEGIFIKAQPRPINEKLDHLCKLFPELDKQLKRKGVNQKLLWEEFKKANPDGFGRSQFIFILRSGRPKRIQ